MKSFIAATNPSKVLVPFATGFECDLFDDKTNVTYHFFNKDREQATTLNKNIETLQELPEKGEYDLILSALPLGPISDFISHYITEQSAKLLSEDGYCVFTFSKPITMNSADQWLSRLESDGLYCAAMIDMPMGVYAPLSMIESEIVIFSKKENKETLCWIVVGEGIC